MSLKRLSFGLIFNEDIDRADVCENWEKRSKQMHKPGKPLVYRIINFYNHVLGRHYAFWLELINQSEEYKDHKMVNHRFSKIVNGRHGGLRDIEISVISRLIIKMLEELRQKDFSDEERVEITACLFNPDDGQTIFSF